MPSEKPANTTEPMSLEKILERLGQVVEKLEKGDLPLEQSLAMFEEGVRLRRDAEQRLDAAEARIDALLSTDTAAGEPATQALAAPSAAR